MFDSDKESCPGLNSIPEIARQQAGGKGATSRARGRTYGLALVPAGGTTPCDLDIIRRALSVILQKFLDFFFFTYSPSESFKKDFKRTFEIIYPVPHI